MAKNWEDCEICKDLQATGNYNKYLIAYQHNFYHTADTSVQDNGVSGDGSSPENDGETTPGEVAELTAPQGVDENNVEKVNSVLNIITESGLVEGINNNTTVVKSSKNPQNEFEGYEKLEIKNGNQVIATVFVNPNNNNNADFIIQTEGKEAKLEGTTQRENKFYKINGDSANHTKTTIAYQKGDLRLIYEKTNEGLKNPILKQGKNVLEGDVAKTAWSSGFPQGAAVPEWAVIQEGSGEPEDNTVTLGDTGISGKAKEQAVALLGDNAALTKTGESKYEAKVGEKTIIIEVKNGKTIITEQNATDLIDRDADKVNNSYPKTGTGTRVSEFEGDNVKTTETMNSTRPGEKQVIRTYENGQWTETKRTLNDGGYTVYTEQKGKTTDDIQYYTLKTYNKNGKLTETKKLDANGLTTTTTKGNTITTVTTKDGKTTTTIKENGKLVSTNDEQEINNAINGKKFVGQIGALDNTTLEISTVKQGDFAGCTEYKFTKQDGTVVKVYEKVGGAFVIQTKTLVRSTGSKSATPDTEGRKNEFYDKNGDLQYTTEVIEKSPAEGGGKKIMRYDANGNWTQTKHTNAKGEATLIVSKAEGANYTYKVTNNIYSVKETNGEKTTYYIKQDGNYTECDANGNAIADGKAPSEERKKILNKLGEDWSYGN